MRAKVFVHLPKLRKVRSNISLLITVLILQHPAQLYNDNPVSGVDGMEVRLTCNCVINTRQDAWQVLSAAASSMLAQLYYANGTVYLVQDRYQATPVRLLNCIAAATVPSSIPVNAPTYGMITSNPVMIPTVRANSSPAVQSAAE